jgi:hypothetical protein
MSILLTSSVPLVPFCCCCGGGAAAVEGMLQLGKATVDKATVGKDGEVGVFFAFRSRSCSGSGVRDEV